MCISLFSERITIVPENTNDKFWKQLILVGCGSSCNDLNAWFVSHA